MSNIMPPITTGSASSCLVCPPFTETLVHKKQEAHRSVKKSTQSFEKE